VRDLDIRATLIANTIQEPLQEQLAAGKKAKIGAFFARITQDERLYAVGYCASDQSTAVASRALPAEIRCTDLSRWEQAGDHLLSSTQGPLHVAVKPMTSELGPAGKLVLVHDMSFVTRRSEENQALRLLFLHGAGRGGVADHGDHRPAVVAWLDGRHALAAARRRACCASPRQVRQLDRRSSSRLPAICNAWFASSRPRHGRGMKARSPGHRRRCAPSFTANCAVRMSSSFPIASPTSTSGAATASRCSVRPAGWSRRWNRSCAPAPAPGSPTAAARPIARWWTPRSVLPCRRTSLPTRFAAFGSAPEEEAGYYYGLSNEGLWPLCHIAHVRPTFRSGDWAQYVAVNRKFAEAVVSESKTKAPIVLVQDYHFALLPRMIREELPEATIITFWHIPWPNPESFAICPWGDEILAGMLGSSILGFHTQFHCNNFVDTVDRQLEARVDRESFTVSFGGKLTAVRRYPISIAWPPEPEMMQKDRCRPAAAIFASAERHAGRSTLLGIGVDRLDYTKGIVERFQCHRAPAGDCNPEWIGRFSFIQIAAPTRSGIDEYHAPRSAQVRAMATQINDRFGRPMCATSHCAQGRTPRSAGTGVRAFSCGRSVLRQQPA
jgi:trehalose 6-phosphate synthase